MFEMLIFNVNLYFVRVPSGVVVTNIRPKWNQQQKRKMLIASVAIQLIELNPIKVHLYMNFFCFDKNLIAWRMCFDLWNGHKHLSEIV